MRVLCVEHSGDRADDGYHGITFSRRRHEACCEVSSSRPGSCDADSRDAGDASGRCGHESGILFVAADDQLDLWVVAQGVEDGIDFCAGDAEDYAHSGVVEAVDDDFGDLLLLLGRHGCVVV